MDGRLFESENPPFCIDVFVKNILFRWFVLSKNEVNIYEIKNKIKSGVKRR
jgi:hypothetical protein